MDAPRVRDAMEQALRLCATSVIPALFPFMAVSGLLLALGLGDVLSPYFAGLMTPLFRLPGCACGPLLLGLIGGYPIGAQTAGTLYRQGALTREEAERLLSFCNNSNPVFLLSVLGSGVFGSIRAGLWLWLIHIASALGVGLLFRGRHTPPSSRSKALPLVSKNISMASAFVDAVRGAGIGMLSVCAFVIFFYVLASPLAALGGRLGPALVGTLELFSLTPLLTADRFGFVLAATMSGWGGLSVLSQSAAVLDGTGLSLRPCLMGKAAQGLLSGLLAMLLAGHVLA